MVERQVVELVGLEIDVVQFLVLLAEEHGDTKDIIYKFLYTMDAVIPSDQYRKFIRGLRAKVDAGRDPPPHYWQLDEIIKHM